MCWDNVTKINWSIVPQIDMTGFKIKDFIHPDDQEILDKNMQVPKGMFGTNIQI